MCVAEGDVNSQSLRTELERLLLSIVRSRQRIAIAVVLSGGIAGVSEYVVHKLVSNSGPLAPIHAVAGAVILGALAAVVTLIVLNTARERHHKIRDDLRRIAELNHQVRNALQVIVYGEYSSGAAEHRQAVLGGVEKIETALRELFPLVGERTNDRPWEEHNRARLRRDNLQIHTPERRKSVGGLR